MRIKKHLETFLPLEFVMCDFCQLDCEKFCLLSAKVINKMVDSNLEDDRAQIATCSELTSGQIEILYNDPKYIIRTVINSYLQDTKLSGQQIDRIIDTDDANLIIFLIKKFWNAQGGHFYGLDTQQITRINNLSDSLTNFLIKQTKYDKTIECFVFSVPRYKLKFLGKNI